MAVRNINKVETYYHAFSLLGLEVNDKAKQVITTLEKEGHTERSICFSIWKTQAKLWAYRRDDRFWNILVNEIRKWSWTKDDPRWQEYWNRKNEEKKAAAIRKELDDIRKDEQAQEMLDKADTKRGSKKMTGYVYFIQGQCGGAIKIGYSVNPEERLKTLQTGYPDTLIILLMIRGNETIERSLHRELNCCRLSGEWFRPDKVLIDKIKELKSKVGA